MEYIKPMFLLLFVLGIVAAVSSRHAAKHYPVEDAGNQDESSLVKKTLKRHGSSLTSAFDFGEEKNKRKVISVSNMDDNPPSLFIDVHNPKDGVTWWANGIYLRQGENPVELPEEVHPGGHMYHHVTEKIAGLYQGAAGVFTYYMLDKDLTLAVMFVDTHRMDIDFSFRLYNVKVYPGSIMADLDLYSKMFKDAPYIPNGEFQRMTKLGSGFSGRGKMTISDTPTLEIDIQMPASYRTTEKTLG